VVTLGLLVLSATVMVSLSRAALRHSAAAREARRELQHRHGAASIRAALLPRCESILAREEATTNKPVASFRTTIRLGRHRFDVIVADEQAKANVNRMLLAAVDVSSFESRLRAALSGSGVGRAVNLRPAPTESPGESTGLPRPVRGIGQVFDLVTVTPERLLDSPGDDPAALGLISIWGDGRINLRRASEASAKLALSPPLTGVEVGRLIGARVRPAQRLGGSLDSAAARDARTSARQRDPLLRLLETARIPYSIDGEALPVTLSSACHSVWVITDDGRRRWYEVEALDTSDPDRPRRSYFAW
jgi:hypothetical protein